MAVLMQHMSLRESWDPGVLVEHVSSRLRRLRGVQLGVMKRPKLRQAPATQSLRRRVRVQDHARLDVRQEYGVAHCIQDSPMSDHAILLNGVSGVLRTGSVPLQPIIPRPENLRSLSLFNADLVPR
jgi:hypothetical protein